jgi:hypothetical protein
VFDESGAVIETAESDSQFNWQWWNARSRSTKADREM